ncbi:protein tyrosine phosphatase [Acinetobacter sp. ANC 4779]|uniref:dual specificity protein phosphatase family protein n=1 Tax=Acinetobacter sp. ANC 4779 TaxID=2529848 RepID=UPI00103A7086|nr:dual specificity protein phosphatase family protein [Acinetobacter sp. ANC 4779]TCB49924.1 protein tyrosine phosphatase [Acinetobacter sp. ANC 4779]
MRRTVVTLLLSSSSLVGCMTSPPLSSEQRPQYWGVMLNQTDNFYQISEHMFRSEQPTAELIPQLKAHHINVVVNLRSRNADLDILPSPDFKLVHLPIHTWAMSREDLLQVMRQIQQAKALDQKVLIHCYHGSDRTGASIAMYRIIFENWKIEDALSEMKYGGYGFHPVWMNIEKIFSPENVKWIQQQLSNPS